MKKQKNKLLKWPVYSIIIAITLAMIIFITTSNLGSDDIESVELSEIDKKNIVEKIKQNEAQDGPIGNNNHNNTSELEKLIGSLDSLIYISIIFMIGLVIIPIILNSFRSLGMY